MIAAAQELNPPPLGEASFTEAFERGPHRYVDLDYARIATWSFGQGPDVLFVHGWPLWSATFRRIAPILARNFRLHFFDLPGAGWTTARDLKRVNLKDHAESIAAVVRALGLERYAIVAHDSGGAIARAHAADNPKVFALVMGNTELPDHIPWQVAIYIGMARLGIGPLLPRAMKIGAIRRSALGFGGCFEDKSYVDGEFGRLIVDRILAPGGFDGHLAFAKNLNPKDLGNLNKIHGAIRCPTLCIWGPGDPFFPIDRARAMLPGFGGGATLLELEGAKLFAHEDRPDEFGLAALTFLRERAG